MNTNSIEQDIFELVDTFRKRFNRANEHIQAAAKAFYDATCLVGMEKAIEIFDDQFHLGKYNFQLLADIGSENVDERVWFLPSFMHGVRKMALPEQWKFFNNTVVHIYKFSTEKPTAIDIGSINQSDWRVAFDKEHAKIRSGQEQLEYIHAKKKEYADRKRLWKVSEKGVVIVNSGTFTLEELEEMVNELKKVVK